MGQLFFGAQVHSSSQQSSAQPTWGAALKHDVQNVGRMIEIGEWQDRVAQGRIPRFSDPRYRMLDHAPPMPPDQFQLLTKLRNLLPNQRPNSKEFMPTAEL